MKSLFIKLPVLLVLFTIAFNAYAQKNSYGQPYDPNAKLKLESTAYPAVNSRTLINMDGIMLNAVKDQTIDDKTFYVALFEELEDNLISIRDSDYCAAYMNEASGGLYNWKEQYWVCFYGDSDLSKYDLSQLFSSIDLSKTKLNRLADGTIVTTDIVKKLQNPVAGDGKNVFDIPVEERDFNFDKNAEPDFSLNCTTRDGYKITLSSREPYILFDQKATYNWRYQFWSHTTKGFDTSKINLKNYFVKIDLAETELNRPRPDDDYLVLKQDPTYNWKADKDFVDFVNWMDANGTEKSVIEKYKEYASMPGKHGKMLDHYFYYSVNNIGICKTEMKKSMFKNNGLDITDYSFWNFHGIQRKMAGGMQTYFEMHKGEYIPLTYPQFALFKDNIKNNTINIKLIELLPKENPSFKATTSGTALEKIAEDAMTNFFGSKVSVKSEKVTISYQELVDNISWQQSLFEKYARKNIIPQLTAKNGFYIYYIANPENSLIQNSATKKTILSAANLRFSNWINSNTCSNDMSAFATKLGLCNHYAYNDTKPNSADSKNSPNCSATKLCDLCRYALGLGASVPATSVTSATVTPVVVAPVVSTPVVAATQTTVPANNAKDAESVLTITAGTSVIADSQYANNSKIETLNIIESVTTIGKKAFANCANLQTVNFNATNCTYAGETTNAFANCASLSKVVFGKNVKVVSPYIFKDCKGLTDVTIPGNIEIIGKYSFYNSSVKNVVLESGVQSIGSYVFDKCANLKTITIPATVNYIGAAAIPRTVTIICPNGSPIDRWAKKNKYSVINK